MPQRLILPINSCKVTASYKTAAYRARFGFVHYGVDLISTGGTATVYALGEGTVLRTGLDRLFGNTIVIRYSGVWNHKIGKEQDVIARCYHMQNIEVKEGTAVTKDTRLGLYGNTGQYSAGAHLHLEFDSNVAKPCTTPTLKAGGHLILAAGEDTSVDPAQLLHIKRSAPDHQTITVDGSCYNGSPYAAPELAKLPERRD